MAQGKGWKMLRAGERGGRNSHKNKQGKDMELLVRQNSLTFRVNQRALEQVMKQLGDPALPVNWHDLIP
jgi:hypothetical protein